MIGMIEILLSLMLLTGPDGNFPVGKIVHCMARDEYAMYKIRFPVSCSNPINWQCEPKELEVWKNDGSRDRLHKIRKMKIHKVEVWRESVLIRFADPEYDMHLSEVDSETAATATGMSFYIDLVIADLRWIDHPEDGGLMEMETPFGDVYEIECGIYDPQKYGDHYEKW
jgi:hypothetical protein